METHVEIETQLFGARWTVCAVVTLEGESAVVVIDEAYGAKGSRALWLRGCDLADRIGRVELERIETECVRAAREQLNASAIKRRMQGG